MLPVGRQSAKLPSNAGLLGVAKAEDCSQLWSPNAPVGLMTQARLNEVALPSATATDASRVISSSQWTTQTAGREPSLGTGFARKCLICKNLQFKSHSAMFSAAFLQTPLSKAPANATFVQFVAWALPIEC